MIFIIIRVMGLKNLGGNFILEISSKRSTAIIAISKTNFEVLECSNFTNCRIQGIIDGECPKFCPFIVDAKRFIRGLKPRNKVEVLTKLA